MKLTMGRVLAAGLLAWAPGAALADGSDATAGATTKVVGWRGDGSGRYPDARPPLRWGRVARSILALRAQADRPKPEQTGRPIADGVVREWLVLGPHPLPEGFKNAKDFRKEIIPGESAFDPSEGHVVAELKWTRVAVETSTLDFRAIFGAKSVGPDARPNVAYACTRIYSPTGGPMAFTVTRGCRDLKIYLNGQPVKAGFHRATLTLAKGWNRLLLRVASRPDKTNPSWYVKWAFFGALGCEYKTTGIAWATPMPAGGVGSPIVVGEKVFVTADVCSLVCVDKRSGKILWVRSTTYLDAATDAEKAAHPDVFSALDPTAERLREIDRSLSAGDPLDAKTLKEKADLEKKVHREMRKVDARRYGLRRPGEAGGAPMTPVSNGKHVWGLFNSGVLACYDLDGNRKWTVLGSDLPGEHGFTSSPLLVDGKVIIYLDHDLRAFDPATGKEIWSAFTRPSRKDSATYFKYHGTACPVRAGSTDCLFTPHGMAVRLSDGKRLLLDFFKLGGGMQRSASPIFSDGLIYKMGPGGLLMIRLRQPDSDTVKPASARKVAFSTDAWPRFYRGSHMASPLLHEGLVYCVSMDGVLTVIDASAGSVVYQKYLDADIRAANSLGAARGGMGASPALGGKNIYLFGNQGTALVIQPGRTFKLLAKNRIEQVVEPEYWREHQEITVTCPAFDGGRIYVRGERNLYCIGK